MHLIFANRKVTNQDFRSKSLQSLGDHPIPHKALIRVYIDEPCIAGNRLEGIIKPISIFAQVQKDWFLHFLFSLIKLDDRTVNVLHFTEDFVHDLLFAFAGFRIDLRVAPEKHPDDLFPVLQ